MNRKYYFVIFHIYFDFKRKMSALQKIDGCLAIEVRGTESAGNKLASVFWSISEIASA